MTRVVLDLRLAVTDPADVPVRGLVRLDLGRRSPAREAHTDDQGRAHFPAVPLGVAVASVDLPDFLPAKLVFRHDGSPRTLRLAVGRPLLVRGAVPPGWVGRPVVVRGLAVRADGVIRDGGFAIVLRRRSAKAGAVTVRVGDAVPVLTRVGADATALELGAFVPEPGATLRGRLASPGGDAWIEVRSRTRGVIDERVGRDGTFEVRGVAPEEVDVSIVVSPDDPDDRLRGAFRWVDARAGGVVDLGAVETPDLGDDAP